VPILLVEDERPLRDVISRALRRDGHDVWTAASGHEALDLVAAKQVAPALVITDISMPGIDGPALVDHLRARYPAILVLYISGFAGQMIDRPGWLTNADGYLQKPFSPTALMSRVRGMLPAS
jgi:CheY-like chemotaxis protein